VMSRRLLIEKLTKVDSFPSRPAIP